MLVHVLFPTLSPSVIRTTIEHVVLISWMQFLDLSNTTNTTLDRVLAAYYLLLLSDSSITRLGLYVVEWSLSLAKL